RPGRGAVAEVEPVRGDRAVGIGRRRGVGGDVERRGAGRRRHGEPGNGRLVGRRRGGRRVRVGGGGPGGAGVVVDRDAPGPVAGTLSLHDALPILRPGRGAVAEVEPVRGDRAVGIGRRRGVGGDVERRGAGRRRHGEPGNGRLVGRR